MHVLLFWMISHCFLLIVHFLFSLCECAADAHDLLLIEAFETICLVHHTNLIFEDLRTIKKLERPCKWCKKRRIIVRKERTFWCFEFASYWNCATLLLLFFFFSIYSCFVLAITTNTEKNRMRKEDCLFEKNVYSLHSHRIVIYEWLQDKMKKKMYTLT